VKDESWTWEEAWEAFWGILDMLVCAAFNPHREDREKYNW
jgi:hypothetical protein